MFTYRTDWNHTGSNVVHRCEDCHRTAQPIQVHSILANSDWLVPVSSSYINTHWCFHNRPELQDSFTHVFAISSHAGKIQVGCTCPTKSPKNLSMRRWPAITLWPIRRGIFTLPPLLIICYIIFTEFKLAKALYFPVKKIVLKCLVLGNRWAIEPIDDRSYSNTEVVNLRPYIYANVAWVTRS